MPRTPSANADAMSLNVHLKRLHLQSPQPAAVAAFYARAYGMALRTDGGVWECCAAGSELHVSGGQAQQLHYALFGCADPADWQALLHRTRQLERADLSAFAGWQPQAIGLRDPEGNCLVFEPPAAAASAEPNAYRLPDAMTQHFALRTQKIEAMHSFYSETLGFDLSDTVYDDAGALRACFVRGNPMHHTLALFGAPVAGFDHQSFETPDWDALKQWADHMGRLRIEIVWGVGRHGPGNDVFFMVRDPDGNLAEISSEIEICAPDRPAGRWKHEERTLNLWGKAILRS